MKYLHGNLKPGEDLLFELRVAEVKLESLDEVLLFLIELDLDCGQWMLKVAHFLQDCIDVKFLKFARVQSIDD